MNRAERRKAKIGKHATRASALALTGLMLVGGFTGIESLGAAPAHAVVDGAGVGQGSDFVGQFIHADGSITYCGELGRIVDHSANPDLNVVTSLPGYDVAWVNQFGQMFTDISVPSFSGAGLKSYNYVLSHYGNTNDSNQAAAVQIALWDLRASGASAGYVQLLNAYKNYVGSDITNRAAQMIQEANAAGSASGAISEPTSPAIVELGAYNGLYEVDAGTKKATIQNGVFLAQPGVTVSEDGKTATVTDGKAHEIQWQGAPPEGDYDRYYRVTFGGEYSYTAEGSGVKYGKSGGAFDQGIVSASPAENHTGQFDAQYIDPDTIWSPVLTTETPSKIVQEGEPFSDTVTFDVAADSNPWRYALTAANENTYAPIVANGTLYGPFLTDPALNPSGTPPVGAPVAATATVKTSPDQGPGTYSVDTGDTVSEETGYYTWVWNIEYENQLDAVKNPKGGNPSIPENYFFTDGFGQATEGQLTPTNLRISTELSDHEVTIGDSFTDSVSVELVRGGWLRDENGERIPFNLRGTAYLTDEKPEQQTEVPAGAVELGTTTLTADSPSTDFVSDAYTIPVNTTAQYVTVQWCLLDEDQAENAVGKAKETCDDFGVPSETAEIVRPEVTTQAQPLGAVKGEISDTAFVTGGVPSSVELEVDFTAYLKPEAGQPKYDENWQPILGENGDAVLWTEDEVADPEAVCEAQPVAQTGAVPVDGEGTYQSPSVKAESAGTIYWVETLQTVPGEPGESSVIHRGKCGLPNETTFVEEPKVTTKAVSEAVQGEEIFDTAIVEGPLSELEDVSYEVTFESYFSEKPVDGINEELCTDETKVWESSKPTPVTTEGEYKSESWKTEVSHVGEILWVETLTRVEITDEGEKRTEVHRGACGEENEITKVVAADAGAAANTGGDVQGAVSIAAGVLALLAAAVGFVMVRKRKRAVATTEEGPSEV